MKVLLVGLALCVGLFGIYFVGQATHFGATGEASRRRCGGCGPLVGLLLILLLVLPLEGCTAAWYATQYARAAVCEIRGKEYLCGLRCVCREKHWTERWEKGGRRGKRR